MALTEEQKRMLRERASKNVEKINGKSERKQQNRPVENTPMPSRGDGISQQQVVQPVAKIFCKNCGNIVDADSKVCAFCGQMLGGGIQQVYIPGNQFQQNVPPVNNMPKRSSFSINDNQKEIIGGILGVALIIILLFVAYHNFQKNFVSDNQLETQSVLDENDYMNTDEQEMQDDIASDVVDNGNASENEDDISSDLNLDDDGIAVENLGDDKSTNGTAEVVAGKYTAGKDFPTGRYILKLLEYDKLSYVTVLPAELVGTDNQKPSFYRIFDDKDVGNEWSFEINDGDVLEVFNCKVSLTQSGGLNFE